MDVVAGLILSAQGAMQPLPEAPPAPLEEIVVTGERIARTLEETASSVVVITSDALQALAAPDRIEQALALVPNLQPGSGGGRASHSRP